MTFKLHEDTLVVRSHHAWVTWVVYGFFLLAIPAAIWAMWTGQAPVPQWFSLLFTALFLVVLPFLLSEMGGARLVTALQAAAAQPNVDMTGLHPISRSFRHRSYRFSVQTPPAMMNRHRAGWGCRFEALVAEPRGVR